VRTPQDPDRLGQLVRPDTVGRARNLAWLRSPVSAGLDLVVVLPTALPELSFLQILAALCVFSAGSLILLSGPGTGALNAVAL
jgi:hypothetical protein